MCWRPRAAHTGEGTRLSDARMSTHARLCSPSLTCNHAHSHTSAFPGCASALLGSILNLLGVAPHTPWPCPGLAASDPPCPVRGLPSEPAQWLGGGWDGAGTQLSFNLGHFRARVTRTPSAHPHWAPHKGQNHRYSETRWVLRCPSVLHFCGPAQGTEALLPLPPVHTEDTGMEKPGPRQPAPPAMALPGTSPGHQCMVKGGTWPVLGLQGLSP